ncbi:hypothetical protein L7F22_001834 [Adiantum nelumboides]|nr:hypothetical protein [Adiantum nelumboides]
MGFTLFSLGWKSASNKVFLMKKLMHLSMKEGSSVSSHLNEFNALYSQLTSKGLNFDDEMKAIFLLCSLPASWDTFNKAISNSTHGGKLAFGTSALLTEEIRRQSLDSGGHGDRHIDNLYMNITREDSIPALSSVTLSLSCNSYIKDKQKRCRSRRNLTRSNQRDHYQHHYQHSK